MGKNRKMNFLFKDSITKNIGLPPRSGSPKALCSALLIAASLSFAGCTDQIDYRGYLPRGKDVQKIHTGLSKTEVISIMGSPSTTSAAPGSGDTLYYISTVVKTTAILEPQIVDREIFAIHFDPEQNVTRLAHYGVEDGKIIDFISRNTPTRGSEKTLLQTLFGDLGKFGAPVQDNTPPVQ